MNKKAIELSMNFLVMIIISLVVFGFGMRFIYKLGEKATKIESMTAQQLDQRIEGLLCESEKVCLGIDRKTLKRKDVTFFGLKIINILGPTTFYVDVDLSKGIDKDGNSLPTPLTDNIAYLPNAPKIINLNRNEERNIGIGVEVLKEAESGTYIFDVAVCYDDTVTANNDATGKCGSGTPPDVYSFKKFYVEVP